MWFLVQISTKNRAFTVKVAGIINCIIKDDVSNYGRVEGVFYETYEGPLLMANLDEDRMTATADPVIFVHGLRTYWGKDQMMIDDFVSQVQEATDTKVVVL